MRRLNRGLMPCILLLCILVATSYAERGKDHIVVAVLPCSDVEKTFKKFHPLTTYLEQQTGLKIELVVPRDYTEFEWAMKNGDIDFALQDPHIYVRLARLYKTDALIRSLTWEGKTSQGGLLIVRKGSGINSVKDLKGKTVMFGPELSAAKWIAAKDFFKEKYIDIAKDLKAYSHGGCCEDIAFHVYLKTVDAGVVCDHFLEEYSEDRNQLGINMKQIIAIGKTKPVPTRVFAARKGLPDDIVNKINRGLLSLDKKIPDHAKILYPAELGGFQRARDSDYHKIKSLL